MSTRQKSFFDQNHVSKPRTHWQRHRSAVELSSHKDNPAKTTTTAPPLPVSSASKSKLGAFAFAALDQENANLPTVKAAQSSNGRRATEPLAESINGLERNREEHLSDEPAATNPTVNPPHTPSTRLPLAELMANSEDSTARPLAQDISPEERVFWEHSRSPHSSDQTSSFATPAPTTRRGSKRARSSSPALSDQDHAKRLPDNKHSFNAHTLHNALKTPQANPADELWNRYSVGSGIRPTSCAPLPPSLVNILSSSSPRANGKDSSTAAAASLRRSASCGIEWPMSKTKKRKLSGPSLREDAGDVFSVKEDQHNGHTKSKLSRVSLLVEKIQKSLSDPPIPDGDSRPKDKSALSAMVKECANLKGVDVAQTHAATTADRSGYIPHRASQSKEASSDFGDLDDEELESSLLRAIGLAEHGHKNSQRSISEQPNTHHGASRKEPASVTGKDETNAPSTTGNSNEVDKITATLTEEDVADEFGDEGDDLDTTDLETMVAKYDTKGPAKLEGPVDVDGGHNPNPYPASTSNCEGAPDAKDLDGARPDMSISRGPVEADDEFGEIGDDDFELAEAAAQNTSGSSSTSNRRVRAIKRYLIVNVTGGQYETPQGLRRPEKILRVEDEKTKVKKVIILRQSWFDSPCTVGAHIHLIGDFTSAGQCIVDDAQNMLILHPDHLISSTVVADSFGCTRRAVLQDRVKATNEASPPQVYGQILHEIFQEALKANRWDGEWLGQVVKKTVMRYLESIYEIKLEVEDAVRYLTSKLPELQAWADVFVSAKPKPEGRVKDRDGQQALMSINKLLDVEEHVWSPMYGLKGNIDATVQITLDDDKSQKTLTVPFEVKTGKNTANTSHRAQTALYTLLVSDRYGNFSFDPSVAMLTMIDVDVAYGILYYMETSEVSRIPAIRHELRHMVMQRNELACYVRHRLELPPMLKNSHMCGRCYAKVPCFFYHKLIDDGTGETTGLKDKFDEVVRHLKPAHQTFFKHWDHLLTKEETDMLKFRRELWTMLSSERERLGRCFANVIIEPGSSYVDEDAPKIYSFRYALVKQTPASGFSFVESQITVGEPIVISDEQGHFALANGYVTHVRKQRITVAVDRRLHNARTRQKGFNEQNNQVFAGIMEVARDQSQPSKVYTQTEPEEPVLFRLDKDEFNNGMATVRNNLIQLMADGPIGSREIRRLVVEGKEPSFKTSSTAYLLPESSMDAALNVDQRRAIEKVMSAKDYALVLGMPGTGKTTTVAHIIRALVSQGKSVLLTSYTHNAVDNILLKIRKDNIGILRLGAVAKVHPEVQEFATLAGKPKKTIEELQEAYHSPKVVATTCLGVNHAVFNERVFDYCIVDEASQITLPVCLGPIRMAKTFVLVGDHNQLPPLVQNAEAREGGLDISLFKLLSDRHPESVVNLEHQYRMCDDIMALSNMLIYDGLLKCGNESVANRSLTIPNIDALKVHHRTSLTTSGQGPALNICPLPIRGSCWLRDLLDPSVKACFIDTDSLLPESHEDAWGSRIVNNVEAGLCTQVVESLLSAGVPGTDIGVISVYRSQLALLKHGLRHRAAAGVELHTADRFQGRDKEVVVVSLVRSNEDRQVGELLRDWRRVNVAFTRARSKLLVVGSASTLAANELLEAFVGLMAGRGWLYNLPRGALGMHAFEDAGTQASAAVVGPPAQEEQDGPRKPAAVAPSTEENSPSGRRRSPPKTGRVSERAILGSRPVLRDIMNDLS